LIFFNCNVFQFPDWFWFLFRILIQQQWTTDSESAYVFIWYFPSFVHKKGLNPYLHGSQILDPFLDPYEKIESHHALFDKSFPRINSVHGGFISLSDPAT